VLLVATHPAGVGDGDGVGLAVGEGDGDGLGDGDALGVGLGVGVVTTVNDCVAGVSSVLPLLVARTHSV
jgi:hypothetical protein